MGAGFIPSSISVGISAIMQTNVDMLEKSIRGEDTNESDYWSSVLKLSASNIAGNIIGGNLIKTNSGWFQPKYVKKALFGKYGCKIIFQSFIGSSLSGAISIAENYFNKLIEEF